MCSAWLKNSISYNSCQYSFVIASVGFNIDRVTTQHTPKCVENCSNRKVVRRHGRGVLWAGGDPCMTGCLECPLARPVLAQSWSQTATNGAWYSTTALLSGRDRPRCLCVLRLSGSEPKTRRTRA